MTLVESVPAGAIADDPAIPNTSDVWLAMVTGAKHDIAVSQFYVSEKPVDQPGIDKLQPVLLALEAAAARGVRVRLLVDAQFGQKYETSLARLSGHGVAVRRLVVTTSMGGVQHAKYLVVDGRDLYLGSANFDWRSLDHIHELGLRIVSDPLAKGLLRVFDGDWEAAGGAPPAWYASGTPQSGDRRASSSVAAATKAGSAYAQIGAHSLHLVASPRLYIPEESAWDLEHITKAIDGARRQLRIQVLDFDTKNRDGSTFEDLAFALQRAAVRGVHVNLLVSHWQKTKKLAAVQALAKVPGIEVRIVTVPEAATGFIPFARVVHAKYMVADDDRVWLGTSNWSGDYFFHSRNVGVMVDGKPLAAQLTQIFDTLSAGPLSEPVPEEVRDSPPLTPNP
jgi:phosphatidylserine/phosphatidylglycerophosphate/cardiolipin synthase-like enzyme